MGDLLCRHGLPEGGCVDCPAELRPFLVDSVQVLNRQFREVLVRAERAEAERDEALGLLRDWIRFHDVDRWEFDHDWEDQVRALVERTRQGDADR